MTTDARGHLGELPHQPQTHHGSRTRPLRRRNVVTRTGRFGPSMTPMVDVTLVILVFFMASSTIAGHEWFLRADLPETRDVAAGTGFALPTPVISADLFMRDGRVLARGVGDEPRPLAALIEQIVAMDRQAAEGLILSIRAADEVPYGSVVALHDAASGRGIRVAIR